MDVTHDIQEHEQVQQQQALTDIEKQMLLSIKLVATLYHKLHNWHVISNILWC